MDINYSEDFYNFANSLKNKLAPDINALFIKDQLALKNAHLLDFANEIINYNDNQKGVFTVLITLLYYKRCHPSQDIRYHQANMNNKGFSGRTFDTKNITPNLKKLGLPSMAESGWLTRSLEQAAPYNLAYPGKIQSVKNPFLQLINAVEEHDFDPSVILRYVIYQSFIKASDDNIKITKLESIEPIYIQELVNILEKQFFHNYHVAGAAKLPMIAFYAIYKILIKELVKYHNCYLAPLGSYTASDRTSKTSGDLEIFNNNGQLVESIEIKLGHKITEHMVKRAESKIYKFDPARYYILSTADIEENDYISIQRLIKKVKINHGCQIILNGVLHTLRYYFRLINNLDDFIKIYSELIESDTELKVDHKIYWDDVIKNLNYNSLYKQN